MPRKMPPEGATATVQTAISAQTADRRAQAVQMRVDGYSLEAITLALEYPNVRAASLDINRALEQSIVAQDHAVDIYREIELRRLDQMLLALNPGIQRGVPRAVEIAIKLCERRAKLLGLDATTKLEITTMDQIDSQIAALTEELARQGLDLEELTG